MDYSKLNDEQLQAVKTDDGPMLILAGAGSGKALLNGTNVLTRGGYCPIEKIKVGTKIFGSDGNTHKVLGVYPQGNKKIIKIKFSDNTEISCCEDHLWTVGGIEDELKTFKTKELMKKPLLKDNSPYIFVPNPAPMQLPEQPVPIDPYFLGLILSVGRFTQHGIRLCLKSEDVIDLIKNKLSDFDLSIKHLDKNFYEVVKLNKEAKSLEEILAVFNFFKNERHIPKIYKINNVPVRRNLLMGFVDGCGINKGKFYEIPTTEKLMNDLQFVVETLGFMGIPYHSKISSNINGKTVNKEINRLTVYPNYKFINKLHTLESKNVECEEINYKKYIVSIKETKFFGKMTCIKVDAPDKLFVTEGCTLTHNTTVLVHKVAHLIENGVDPKRILMLTFTNKAADEMMERINKLLGSTEKISVQGGTYHSFCAELLRRNADEIGFESDFSICDSPDAAEIINLLKERMGFKKEDNLPTGKVINSLFSYCINQGKTIEYAIRNKFTQCEGKETELEQIKEAYTIYKYENNILDYDDLLIQTNLLLDGNIGLCRKISNFYKYILVDEYQDSNKLQMELLMKLRQFENKNLCVVGDPEQCVAKGTKIKTISGYKNVEDLDLTDKVLAASGRGGLLYTQILDIQKKQARENIFNIKTITGKELNITPDHIVFCNPITHNKFFVYLLFNEDYGYRIGYYNSNIKQFETAYRIVCDRENGHKLWVLDVVDSAQAAKEKISNYLNDFKIKTNSFSEINCFTEQDFYVGKEILDSKNMFLEYPVYIKSRHNGSIFKINYTLFGDTWIGSKRKFYKSLIVSDSLNKEGADYLSKTLDVPVCNKHQEGQKNRYVVKKIDFANSLEALLKDVKTMSQFRKFNTEFVENAFITNTKSMYLPASHIKPGMYICAFDGEKIVEEKVTEVNVISETTEVYDINIDKLHNFFANDICVHNCIYGFRGSRYENIIEFPDQFPGCEIIKLNKNYRSNQEILDLSNELISGRGVFENKLKGKGKAGYKPKLVYVPTQQDEATWILRKIEQYLRQGYDPKDIAVLSRGSNDSSALESKLIGIDYNKYGGIRFWERESTKNVLSYLKVLNNYKDEISWFRLLKLYPNIGSVNAKKITEGILQNGVEELEDTKYSKKQYAEFINELYLEFIKMQGMDLTEKIEYLVNEYYQKVMRRSINNRKIKETDKRRELRDLDDDIERLQNLIELSKGYKSLNAYINDLLLDTSSSNTKDNAITISTIHSAKGLEWKVVFILDCIQGKFPSDKGVSAATAEAIAEHEEELEEEKRIFYVAVTRCKEDLYLMYPQFNIYAHIENDLSEYLVEKSLYKNNCEIVKYL